MNKLHKIGKIILIISFVFGTLNTNAQKFKGGLLGGLSTSQIDGDTQEGFNKLGLFSGVFVETDFTEVVGAKLELYYIGKGAKQNLGGVEVFKTQLNYVEMPFLLKIEPVKKVVLDVGVAVSYLISARQFEYGDEVPASLIDIHNFDFDAIVSGSYYFLPHTAVNVRFSYSFVPVSTGPNWFNYNFNFGFLYLF